MKELVEIQSKLKAPKDNYNSFGKYKYRSAESILESVKPLLKEYGCILTVSDDIVMVGDRIYVKATATISNEKGEYITTSAFAREAEVGKNGMDVSQVTGATSSYARKYALNGLFCIDDTKDTDTEEYQAQKKKAEKPKANEKSDTLLMALQEVETASSIEQLLAIRNAYFNLMSPNEQTEFTNKLTERKKKIQG
jgi:hypothetical protein